MKRGKRIFSNVATAIVLVATLVLSAYIMIKGLGLVDNLDFGAGAYFYADIPDYEKIDDGTAYSTNVPRWVHILLFLGWGFLMYRLWCWIDRK